jgi:hypothetical protein
MFACPPSSGLKECNKEQWSMMRLGGGGDTRIVSLQESSPSWRMVCFAPFFVLRSEGTYRDDSPQWFGEGIGSNGGDLDSMLQAAPGEVASLCSFTGANALARMRSTSHILVQHVSSPAEHARISCEGMMGTCTARHGEEADFPARRCEFRPPERREHSVLSEILQKKAFLLQEIKIEVLSFAGNQNRSSQKAPSALAYPNSTIVRNSDKSV